MATVFDNPRLVSVGAAVATIGIHAWSMPDTHAKIVVSTFFTQTSMPTVLLIFWKLLQAIGTSLIEALASFTKVQ